MQKNEENLENPNALQTFMFGTLEVRIIVEAQGQILFVAKDICDILGYTNLSQTLKRLSGDDLISGSKIGDDLISNYPIPDKKGRMQLTNMLTEAGLENLIAGSRKAIAQKFKDWVDTNILTFLHSLFVQSAAIQLFMFETTGIRVLLDELGEPWFIAMDVAKVLDYTDAQAMTRLLDSSEKQNRQIVGFGNRGVSIITEAGLYFAIIKSNKTEAVHFQKWLAKEVLPTLRKTGSYHLPTSHSISRQEVTALLENYLTRQEVAQNYLTHEEVKHQYILRSEVNAKLEALEDFLNTLFKQYATVQELHGQYVPRQEIYRILRAYKDEIYKHFPPLFVVFYELLEETDLAVIGDTFAQIQADIAHLRTLIPTKAAVGKVAKLCYLYLIQQGDKPIYKPGISTSVEIRESQLNTGNSERLHTLLKTPFPNTEVAKSFENAFKKLFAPKQIKGEWFELNEADLKLMYSLADIFINYEATGQA